MDFVTEGASVRLNQVAAPAQAFHVGPGEVGPGVSAPQPESRPSPPDIGEAESQELDVRDAPGE